MPKITIDGKQYKCPVKTSGAFLYALASIPANRCLFKDGSTQRIFNTAVSGYNTNGVVYGDGINVKDGDVFFTTP